MCFIFLFDRGYIHRNGPRAHVSCIYAEWQHMCFLLRFTGLRPQFKFSTAILAFKDEGSPKQCGTEEKERQREREGE